MNDDATIGMPATALKTAHPPRRSIAETIRLARSPKTMKTRCAVLPQRTLMISRKVWALGARRFTSMAMMPKRRICTVAPAAYQKGPVMP